MDGVLHSAVLLRGGKRVTTVRVTGHIEAYDEGVLPRPDKLVNFVDGKLGSKDTQSVLRNPNFGGIYPVEFDTEEPTKITVHACDYSFELDFVEQGDSRFARGIDVRHVGNQG